MEQKSLTGTDTGETLRSRDGKPAGVPGGGLKGFLLKHTTSHNVLYTLRPSPHQHKRTHIDIKGVVLSVMKGLGLNSKRNLSTSWGVIHVLFFFSFYCHFVLN